MPSTVQLTKDFDIPAYLAGLEVLLHLAAAVTDAFSPKGIIDVLDASERGDWIALLFLLGKTHTDPQTRVVDTQRIDDVWQAYFLLNDVKHLEDQVLQILQQARAKSVASATAKHHIVSYLEVANDNGHSIAKQILKKHGLAQLLPAAPVQVEVFHDGSGTHYCAGTSRSTGQIRWAYQPLKHALPGTILADFVFAHEYLSHLVPRNKHLNSTIREQWLVAALHHSLDDGKLGPYWKLRLWPHFRSALVSHVTSVATIIEPEASPVRYSGIQGAEEALRTLSVKDGPFFWQLTKEILESDDDQSVALAGHTVAKSLTYRGLGCLKGVKQLKLQDLSTLLSSQGP
jgi:hypothetical protein